MRKRRVSLAMIDEWALEVASRIKSANPDLEEVVLHGIPRGGLVPTYNVLAILRALGVRSRIGTLDEAHYIIDDIIDSGATMERAKARNPHAIFLCCIDKLSWSNWPTVPFDKDCWAVFPWESAEATESAETVEDNVRRILQFIGEDVEREGLAETPTRVVKAYREWFSGYLTDPDSIVKVFADGAESADEMIVCKDIRFYSHCEHHMAPFFGTVTIAYIPDGKIVGLSKLPRLVEVFARRLQVQERLTNQIADYLEKALAPRGVAVLVSARHLCVESRGIRKTDSTTITSALRGVLKSNPDARSEFLRLAQ